VLIAPAGFTSSRYAALLLESVLTGNATVPYNGLQQPLKKRFRPGSKLCSRQATE